MYFHVTDPIESSLLSTITLMKADDDPGYKVRIDKNHKNITLFGDEFDYLIDRLLQTYYRGGDGYAEWYLELQPSRPFLFSVRNEAATFYGSGDIGIGFIELTKQELMTILDVGYLITHDYKNEFKNHLDADYTKWYN